MSTSPFDATTRAQPLEAAGAGACLTPLSRFLSGAPDPSERVPLLIRWLTTACEQARGEIAQADRSMSEGGESSWSRDRDWWERLLEELGRYDDEEVFELLTRSPAYRQLQSDLSGPFAEYAHRRDLARSRHFLAAHRARRGIDALSDDLRRHLERETATLERLRRGLGLEGLFRRLIAIGVGATPETFSFYAASRPTGDQLPGAAVAVDRDVSAAAGARHALRELGHRSVQVLHADGARLDYRGFDVIHIANFVAPKSAVLAAIARTGEPGALVVVRVPKLLETLLCDAIDNEVLGAFEELECVPSHYCRMDSVFLRLGSC